jgi:CheY-like chemotaxis protein
MEDFAAIRLLKILVVDDNRDAAATLGTLLQLWGHEVCVTTSGEEALNAAPSFLPDLVLLDVEMPKMQGGKIAEALREMQELKWTSIVAISGTDPEDSRLRSYRFLFDDYLIKPYNLERLERLLGSYALAHS